MPSWKKSSTTLVLLLNLASTGGWAQSTTQNRAGQTEAAQARDVQAYAAVTQAQTLMDHNNLVKAAALLQQAALQDPNKYSSEVHNRLGLIFERQDNVDQSLAEYQKALESAVGQGRDIPQHNLANMNNNKGRKLQAAGQLDQARSVLEEAIRLDPTHPMYHNNLGSVLQAQGDLESAAKQYQKSLELDPHMELATMNLAKCNFNLGRFDQAKTYFRKFIQDHPQSPQCKQAQDQISYLDNKTGLPQGDDGAPDYYQAAISKGILRWPNEMMPLKVYCATGYGVDGFRPFFQQALATSLNQWSNATGNRLTWRPVATPDEADIICSWAAYNSGFKNFRTEPDEQGEISTYKTGQLNGNTYIRQVLMAVATHNPTTGRVISDGEAKNVCLHEVGHALGIIGHSPNYHDIMFFITNPGGGVVERNLSQRDAATMNMLYSNYPSRVSTRGQNQ